MAAPPMDPAAAAPAAPPAAPTPVPAPAEEEEDATKINTLAKGKERYYCRWSVDIGSFEYTGFKLQ